MLTWIVQLQRAMHWERIPCRYFGVSDRAAARRKVCLHCSELPAPYHIENDGICGLMRMPECSLGQWQRTRMRFCGYSGLEILQLSMLGVLPTL